MTRIRVAPAAERQIRSAAAWWREHRDKSPDAFAEDLEAAYRLIVELPRIGKRVRHATIPDVRRLLMARTRYYLYFLADETADSVEVLALWHTSRGASPGF